MKYSILFLLCSIYLATSAQDTIVLLSGDKIPVKSYTVNDTANLVEFVNKRGKDKFIEREFVFCIMKANGEEDLIYSDSVFEEDTITVADMRDFIAGAITCRENYHAYLATASGFIVGAGSVYLFPELGIPVFWSPVIPGAYTAIIGATRPSQKCMLKKYPEAASKPYFANGYLQVASEKRVNNVVKGSLVGIAAMIITAIIVSQ
jgi:hypothetical protein